MPLLSLRRLVLLASALLLAACEVPTDYTTSSSNEPARAGLSFQPQLDALGIPLQLPPGKAILVNIPSYELIAFEDGVPVLRSRVIIGTPEDRTPRMDSYTSQVTFRPEWLPTPEMVSSGEVSPGLRGAGENNPMGLVAIRLAPGQLIYLHDTNQRYLFDREHRAFSHGCIRVERWEALVAWLLGQDEDWVRAMAMTPPTKAFATPHVPVMIRYLPVFPAEDGRALVHADIYGLGGSRAALRRVRQPL